MPPPATITDNRHARTIPLRCGRIASRFKGVAWVVVPLLAVRRNFKDLSAQEVLALAISLEERGRAHLHASSRGSSLNFPKVAISLDAMCVQRTVIAAA